MQLSIPPNKNAGNRPFKKSKPRVFLFIVLSMLRLQAAELLFPALSADLLSPSFPRLQGPNGYAHLFCKGFLAQAQGFSVCPNLIGLSIIKKPVEFIQEICYRHTIESCQSFCRFLRDVLCQAFLYGFVNIEGYAHLICHFCLKQSSTVSTPAKLVRHVCDLLVSAIPLIELGSLQNLTGSAQRKTVYEQGCILHLRIFRLRKQIHIIP